MSRKLVSANRFLPAVLIAAVVLMLSLANSAGAQRPSRDSGPTATIAAGTTLTVRTNERIHTGDSDGRVFTGTVEKSVMNRGGDVAIPKGSPVELVVKRISDDDVALDLDSVMINGRRYGIDTEENVIGSERREGIGTNERTGKYVGGGALLGAIIGGITGGGKGAAIGAGAGAAAGAGAQVLTRGRSIEVPSESLLTFRLQRPLRAPVSESGFYRDGQHYHPGYANDSGSIAYQEGLQAGRLDAARNLPRNPNSNRWNSGAPRLDYESGYNRGYEGDQKGDYQSSSDRYKQPNNNRGTVHVGRDNNVTWQAPAEARLYVQVDNQRPQLFAESQSGSQAASWISTGHLYVFTLRDLNGNEIARDQLDLRRR